MSLNLKEDDVILFKNKSIFLSSLYDELDQLAKLTKKVKFLTNVNVLKYNSFIIFIFCLFYQKTKDLGIQ